MVGLWSMQLMEDMDQWFVLLSTPPENVSDGNCANAQWLPSKGMVGNWYRSAGRHSDCDSTLNVPFALHIVMGYTDTIQYYATATAQSGGTVTATSLGTAIVESAGNAFAATYGTAIAGNGAVSLSIPSLNGLKLLLTCRGINLGGQATLGFLGFGTAQSGGTIHVGSVRTYRLANHTILSSSIVSIWSRLHGVQSNRAVSLQ